MPEIFKTVDNGYIGDTVRMNIMICVFVRCKDIYRLQHEFAVLSRQSYYIKLNAKSESG